MGSKRTSEHKSRRHVWLYDSDWERLGEYFGDSVGRSDAVCRMVRAALDGIAQRAERESRNIKVKADDSILGGGTASSDKKHSERT